MGAPCIPVRVGSPWSARYYANAVQIIPPHDAGIAAEIQKHLDIPAAAWQVDQLLDDPQNVDKTQEMTDAYFDMVKALAKRNRQV